MLGLSRWPIWRRWFGSKAERAAASFLRDKGYGIVARNVRLPMGELDVIALDGRTIVFVEVRATEGDDVSRPAMSVDAAKQKKLTELALCYLQRRKLLRQSARFDVVAIAWPTGAKVPTIQHYINAFEPVGKWQMFT